jgi:8-oxo-dGTP pyrophosphatase MutT (NUDIX family)
VSHPVPVCPHCALEVERPLLCERCGWRWYANPLPAAAVLLERPGPAGDPRVLLLRRAVDPGRGGWDFPAGYLEPGESFETGARREAAEEAGMEIVLTGLSGVYHSPAANAVTVVYRARATQADAPVAPDAESDDHAWVSRHDAPAWVPRMAFPSMAAALADWAAERLGGPAAGAGDDAALHSNDR